jgi:small subunit ribosomal protein S17
MRKQRTGTVISNKMNKTAIVRVDRMVPHKKYGKRYRVSKNYAAHDEMNTTQIGQIVTIEETRPMSKTKRWVVLLDDRSEQPVKTGSRGTSTDSDAPVEEAKA